MMASFVSRCEAVSGAIFGTWLAPHFPPHMHPHAPSSGQSPAAAEPRPPLALPPAEPRPDPGPATGSTTASASASAQVVSLLMPRTSARPCKSHMLPRDCTQRLLRLLAGIAAGAACGRCWAAVRPCSTSQLPAGDAFCPRSCCGAELTAAAPSTPSASGTPAGCLLMYAAGSLAPAAVLAGDVLSVSTEDIVTTVVTGPAPPAAALPGPRLPVLLLLKLLALPPALLLSSTKAQTAGVCTARPPPLLRLVWGSCLQQPPQHRRQQRKTLQDRQHAVSTVRDLLRACCLVGSK